ncbi:site-2 protease family protein [Methanococcoides burtonii]|uniref:Peptidase M50 family protein n=1 Tax=Methanococcoides burtonii (strain DSM 6242 / NBRC 107633 / OCM 468 / ACE-M) TaxID=259564 RepID=Q12Z71_METBU|nr:site-2 protease family protein [Methanococcoides burtonii]ABE51255.1 peptidase M50 family protein [Methanococcoides burtonii DSM 6242]
MVSTSTLFALFLVYWAIVSILDKKGIFERYNISTYGPVLMIRTVKGQALLDTLARPKRSWRTFANIGIVLMFVGMLAMFLIIIISDIAMLASIGESTLPEPGKFNEARNIFLIPGVNEFIPLTWGVIALLVTLVVHEFSHAILCRVEGIRVKSMGILLAIVPIGGFAEPDEEELFGVKKEDTEGLGANTTDGPIERRILGTEKEVMPKKVASREQRARILAAGVMSNFVVALIAFILFFGPVLGAIAPMSDTMIINVTSDSSANIAGLENGMVITQIDDTSIQKANDIILYMNNIEAGAVVQVHASKDHNLLVYDVEVGNDTDDGIKGMYVNNVVTDSPAEAMGLESGMLIIKIDDTAISSSEDFVTFMNFTKTGQVISVETVIAGKATGDNVSSEIFEIELASHPEGGSEKGFLGIYYRPNEIEIEIVPLGMSIGEFPAKDYLAALKAIPSMLGGFTGWIIILGLPIFGFAGEGFPGFSGQLAQFYSPIGWGEPLGIGIFWIANTLLWVGWLNFYVGLFNCLPAVPLDGGHVFRDYLHALISRFISDEAKAKEVSSAIAASFTMLILASFLFMIFGPYIVHGF